MSVIILFISICWDQCMWFDASTLILDLGCEHCLGKYLPLICGSFVYFSLHREVGGVGQYAVKIAMHSAECCCTAPTIDLTYRWTEYPFSDFMPLLFACSSWDSSLPYCHGFKESAVESRFGAGPKIYSTHFLLQFTWNLDCEALESKLKLTATAHCSIPVNTSHVESPLLNHCNWLDFQEEKSDVTTNSHEIPDFPFLPQ